MDIGPGHREDHRKLFYIHRFALWRATCSMQNIAVCFLNHFSVEWEIC